MPNVLDLKRRIRSVKNTRQITKAMKMVSAAKLRRAQERALSSRPYARMLASVLESLVRRADLMDPETGELNSPLLVQREEKNVLLLVVSGDKGFAGAFNANIVKAATKFIGFEQGKNIDIVTIGRKGRDNLRRRYPIAPPAPEETPAADDTQNTAPEAARPERARTAPVEMLTDYPGMFEKLRFDEVRRISDSIIHQYTAAEIDAVYLVYNEFKSVIAQRVVVEKLLPIKKIGEQDVAQADEKTPEQLAAAGEAAMTAGVSLKSPETAPIDEDAAKFGNADVDYIYEQSPAEIFNHLLPMYITTQIYHAMIESIAAEHAARMTAMDSASNNASDMIDSLTLTMNRVRQAAITKEIIEIVSGAEAL